MILENTNFKGGYFENKTKLKFLILLKFICTEQPIKQKRVEDVIIHRYTLLFLQMA